MEPAAVYTHMNKEIEDFGLLGEDDQLLKGESLIEIDENSEPGYSQVTKEHIGKLF